MPLACNFHIRLFLIFAIIFSSILTTSGLVDADPIVGISVQGDINVLDADLRNVTFQGSVPTADIALRNQHPLWYVISQNGLAIPGSKLQTWVLLPPCRARITLSKPTGEYDCTKSVASLGRMPIRQGEEVGLFADGVGADVIAQKKLAAIYGLEVFWRLALNDALPLDVGTALSDVAIKVADWDLQALGKNLPIFTLYKIGKAFSDNDLLQMVSEVNGALSNSAFRAFLETQLGLAAGTLPSGLAIIDVALRIEKVLELPLIFGIEGVTSVGKPFGTMRLVPYISGTAQATSTPSSSQATPNARNAIAYKNADGALVTQNLDDGSINTIPPPEPGVKDFTISADLSTYAWITAVQPRSVRVKVVGQSSKPITTYDEISQQAARQQYGGLWPDYNGFSLSLSDDGSLLSVGPLGVGADGWRGGQLIFNTRDGRLISSCGGFTGRFSPNRTLLAALWNMRGPKGPGVTDQHPSICEVGGTNGGAAQALNAVIENAMSDSNDGSSTYWVAVPPTWRNDSRAIIYGQRREQASQNKTTNDIVLATSTGTQVLLESPAAAAAEMVMSPDDRYIIFGQYEHPEAFLPAKRGPESLWLIGIDASGLRKIAEGTSPFWVSTQSSTPISTPTSTPVRTATATPIAAPTTSTKPGFTRFSSPENHLQIDYPTGGKTTSWFSNGQILDKLEFPALSRSALVSLWIRSRSLGYFEDTDANLLEYFKRKSLNSDYPKIANLRFAAKLLDGKDAYLFEVLDEGRLSTDGYSMVVVFVDKVRNRYSNNPMGYDWWGYDIRLEEDPRAQLTDLAADRQLFNNMVSSIRMIR